MADPQMPPPGLQGSYLPQRESRVSQYAARLRDLKQKKQPWLTVYQALARVFLSMNLDFTQPGTPTPFLIDDVFDNTPQGVAYKFAAACLSMLWPDAARTFNLVPVPQLRGSPQVEAYFKAATARLHASMDRPEAGLQLALMEHFLDQGVFGTSGVAALEGPEDDPALPVVYESWDVKTMCIDEDSRGYVDTVFIEIEQTVRQIMQEYGSGKPGDKVSAKVQELYDAQKYDEKVEVVKVLEPKSPVRGKKGVLAMPYRSCHVDMTNRTIMREGGFEEMPVAVARMIKRAGEVQGRSFGMVALPASINLNNISEGIIIGTEKQLSPPIYVLDDGRLGGTIVDTSADGMTVINTSGRPFGEKPIGAISTVGDMTSTKDLKEQFIEAITRDFMLDVLFDLGGDRPMMTAYESSVRNRLRGESTGSLSARQIMEVLTPTIKRTFNIHYRKGYMGDFPGIPKNAPGMVQRRKWMALGGKDDMIVPDIVKKAVEAGLDIYDIEYISPAQRFMQAEKLQGLMNSMDAKIAVAAVRPDILDGTDLDLWARDVDKYSGAPNTSQRTLDQIKELRAAMAQRQGAAEGLQAGAQLADMQLKSAQARAAMGTTQR